MRLEALVMSCLTLAVLTSPVSSATSDVLSRPITTTVASATAVVRSGPGDDYYETQTLPQGFEVEVFRRTHDGWLGIRPPERSFSWVFGRHLNLVAEGVGEINKSDVAARVGSLVRPIRNSIQVRLQRGERVAVLDASEEVGQLWYRIAPPSGEFRWIHERDVAPPATPSGPAPLERPSSEIAPASYEEEPVNAPEAPAGGSGWVATTSHNRPVGEAVLPIAPVDYPAPPRRVAEDPRFKAPGLDRLDARPGTRDEHVAVRAAASSDDASPVDAATSVWGPRRLARNCASGPSGSTRNRSGICPKDRERRLAPFAIGCPTTQSLAAE